MFGLHTLIHVTENKNYFIIQCYWIVSGRKIVSVSYAARLFVQWEKHHLYEYFGHDIMSLGYCFPAFSKESDNFIFKTREILLGLLNPRTHGTGEMLAETDPVTRVSHPRIPNSPKPQWKPQSSQTRSLLLHSSSILRDRKYSPL